MLRTLKHAFNAPRLLGVKATSASGNATVGISGDDVTAASASTGKVVVTLGDSFSRAGVCVGSPFSGDVGASGACLIDADPAYNTASFTTHDGSAGDDGSFNGLILGYDSLDSNYVVGAPFDVRNAWNSARLELFKVTPHATTPAINIGSSKATLTRNGAGDYTLTFKRPFSSAAVVAVGTPIKTTASHLHIVSCTALACRVLVGSGGSGDDNSPFYLVVQGSDNPQYGSKHRKASKVSDRLPRLVAGHIAYSGGTPSIANGTGDFTITDTGTGVLTVTFAAAFAREPIVIAGKNTAGLVTFNAAAGTTLVINCFNGAGSAADPADIHFLAFGYDDALEYAI
jgi:hypothetical protein